MGFNSAFKRINGPLVSKHQSTKDTETAKVRVKVSYDDIVKGGDTSPHITNLGTRRRQMVTFALLETVHSTLLLGCFYLLYML